MADESGIEREHAARRAFDAVAAARQASTLDELNGVMGKALGALGFTNFLVVAAASGPEGVRVSVTFGAGHEAWGGHYMERGFASQDVLLDEVLRTGDALFWSDLPRRRVIAGRGRRVFDEAADFRLREGFALPIFHPDGSISSVAAMGEHIDATDPDVRTAAHLLSIHYAAVGRRLLDATAPGPRPRLSPRQLECLRWARQGKSSTDIADILGLSAHTVNEYLADACARLGVRTRAQAVAEAAIHGLIEL